jgi:hypothetical protein
MKMPRLSSIYLIVTLFVPGTALAAAWPDPCSSGNACQVRYDNNRIAIDADGNFNDPDDWAAAPLTLAILARAGLQDRLVHFSFNNHLGGTDLDWQPIMRRSTHGAARRFGFALERFFNAQVPWRLDAGLANLRAEAERATADDPLFILAQGPMEFLWRALNGIPAETLQHVTVISHSLWNDLRVWPPAMTRNHEDVRALGVKWLRITDQNGIGQPWGLNTRQNFLPWDWLRTAAAEPLRWVYERMTLTGKGDASDAGMAYFLVTGDPYGTPDKLRRFFGAWVDGQAERRGTP